MLHIRLVFAPFLLLVACGQLPNLDAPQSTSDPIVNGSRDPINIVLSDGERMAIVYLADPTGNNFCTGTLVAPRLVISAAHCVQDVSASEMLIGFGADPKAPAALIPVLQIRVHPSVDFSLIILGVDATTAVPIVEPIAMNREPITDAWLGRWVDAAGFGMTYSSATGLFFASVEVFQYVNGPEWVVSVDGHGIQGICYGDSGGPIIWQPDPAMPPVVVGTEQWGDQSCVDQDHLSRVDALADWVDGIVAAGLPPEMELVPCGDVGSQVECIDGTAQWCQAGFLREEICDSGLCGYLGSSVGVDCLPAECRGLDYYGACEENNLVYCSAGGLETRNCTNSDQFCMWNEAEGIYACGCDRCNGTCVNYNTDVNHCGGCNNRCQPANATGLCVDRACLVDGCSPGFSDDDGDPSNGCEVAPPAPPQSPGSDDEDTDGCGGCNAASPSLALPWALGAARLLRRRKRKAHAKKQTAY